MTNNKETPNKSAIEQLKKRTFLPYTNDSSLETDVCELFGAHKYIFNAIMELSDRIEKQTESLDRLYAGYRLLSERLDALAKNQSPTQPTKPDFSYAIYELTKCLKYTMLECSYDELQAAIQVLQQAQKAK